MPSENEEIAELRKALEPLADFGAGFNPGRKDDEVIAIIAKPGSGGVVVGKVLTLGDCRRASEALAHRPPSPPRPRDEAEAALERLRMLDLDVLMPDDWKEAEKQLTSDVDCVASTLRTLRTEHDAALAQADRLQALLTESMTREGAYVKERDAAVRANGNYAATLVYLRACIAHTARGSMAAYIDDQMRDIGKVALAASPATTGENATAE